MKIAQIMAGAAQGGAELFFERMTIALAQAGDDVLPLIRAEPARVARFADSRLAAQTFRFGGPLDFTTRPQLKKAAQQFGADIAIAWMSRAASYAPQGPWTLIGRLGGYYDLKYFRRCDHLIGNTQDIVRWIIAQGWPAERVHYLPNFVEDFAPVTPAPRSSDGQTILALGRLHEVKGFDTLIQAMTKLPDATLLIAGEGPERPKLEALINTLDLAPRVKLLGWRTDTGALLKAADLFVSSSRHEPLGNMVLEAFSAQTPVLAAAAEGPRETIRDHVDGILVPIDDAAALARAARMLLASPAQRAALAAAGRARFEAEFAAAPVVATWRATLSRLRPR